jgi:hypothetical protein
VHRLQKVTGRLLEREAWLAALDRTVTVLPQETRCGKTRPESGNKVERFCRVNPCEVPGKRRSDCGEEAERAAILLAILPLTLAALAIENEPARTSILFARSIEPERRVALQRDHQVAARLQPMNRGVRVNLLHQVVDRALPRQPLADANIFPAQIVSAYQDNQPLAPPGGQFPPKVAASQRPRHLENDPLQLRRFAWGRQERGPALRRRFQTKAQAAVIDDQHLRLHFLQPARRRCRVPRIPACAIAQVLGEPPIELALLWAVERLPNRTRLKAWRPVVESIGRRFLESESKVDRGRRGTALQGVQEAIGQHGAARLLSVLHPRTRIGIGREPLPGVDVVVQNDVARYQDHGGPAPDRKV